MERLCPSDQFHYLDLQVRRRTRHLVELLNVQVSAAAVVVDGGEAAQALAKKLDEATPKRRTVPKAANDEGVKQKPLRPQEKAEVDALVAATANVWSTRSPGARG